MHTLTAMHNAPVQMGRATRGSAPWQVAIKVSGWTLRPRVLNRANHRWRLAAWISGALVCIVGRSRAASFSLTAACAPMGEVRAEIIRGICRVVLVLRFSDQLQRHLLPELWDTVEWQCACYG